VLVNRFLDHQELQAYRYVYSIIQQLISHCRYTLLSSLYVVDLVKLSLSFYFFFVFMLPFKVNNDEYAEATSSSKRLASVWCLFVCLPVPSGTLARSHSRKILLAAQMLKLTHHEAAPTRPAVHCTRADTD